MASILKDSSPVELFLKEKMLSADRHLIRPLRFLAKQSWQLKPVIHGIPAGLTPGSIWLTPQTSTFSDWAPGSELLFSENGLNMGLKIAPNTTLKTPLGVFIQPRVELKNTASLKERRVITLGAGSTLQWIEYWGGDEPIADGAGLSLSEIDTEIHLGPGAKLEHYRLLGSHAQQIRLGTTRVFQDQDSEYRGFEYQGGSRLGIQKWQVEHRGINAFTELKGLVNAAGSDQLTESTSVIHRVPGGKSQQLFKGLLKDRSVLHYASLVDVKPHAISINAKAYNHHLLLSDHTQVVAKPELAIEADAIWCAHGATTGRLDEESLFYLESRGLSQAQAQLALVEAFVQEVLPVQSPDWIRAFVLEKI